MFFILHLLPGDPARNIAGLLASQAQVQQIRHELGLDLPLSTQYVRFVSGLLHGDLGTSIVTGQPVAAEIAARAPYTLELALLSTLMASTLGIAAGLLAAARHNGLVDVAITALASLGVSMPVYWLGLLLIIAFAVDWRLLPAGGSDQPLGFVLPTLTLASYSTALIARMTRSAMLEAVRQDYVRTARAKGAGNVRVLVGHAFRNALLPVITAIGLQFGFLLGGAVLTESIFGWPGIGRLLVDSILARDYPVVQGVVLAFSAVFLVVNIVVDFAYLVADPRIRYS